MPKPKLKLYTYHGRYIKVRAGKPGRIARFFNIAGGFIFNFFYGVGSAVAKFFKYFVKVAVFICYQIGNGIFTFIQKTWHGIKNDISSTKSNIPKRFKLVKTLEFSRGMMIFAVCVIVALGSLSSLHLIAKGLQLKTQILQTVGWGGNYLTQGKSALSGQDLTEAQNRFALAYKTFSQGQADIAQSGQVLNSLLNLLPQKRDGDKLLDAAGLIAKSGQNFVDLEQDFSKLKLTQSGVNSDGDGAAVFNDISLQVSQALQNVTLANRDLSSVNAGNLPQSERENFVQLQSQLANAQTALENFSSVFGLVKTLLVGDKTVLVLFENNNELRAGGGFIGTFGLLKVKDGSITKMQVSSVYDLDGQLDTVIKPPKPILNVSDRWFLRDSNWFADFPSTAKKVSDFYEQEGGETPDLIIALTPNIIIDWLKITGPVSMPKYGLVLTPENFVENTQVASTMSNDLPTNSPKQVLADLVPILLQRLSQISKDQLPQVIQSLQDNLNGKQIAIYSRDPDTETALQNFNWAGNLLATDRDYLSVVGSNLGGTKTDLEVEQKMDLVSTIDSQGTVTDELTITRTNKMPKLSATNNLSFIRVYVPLGSKLISNSGFDPKDLSYPAEDYKIDPDAYEWEKNSLIDNLTGTMIGVESGKTFFGNWSSLDGGETKVIKLVYQLPFKVQNIDHYSLTAQKQLGSTDQKLNWTFNFPGFGIAWDNFDPESLQTSSLTSGIILDKDYLLGLVLQKR